MLAYGTPLGARGGDDSAPCPLTPFRLQQRAGVSWSVFGGGGEGRGQLLKAAGGSASVG